MEGINVNCTSGPWSIQVPPNEGAAFLLYQGVMVGRIYGGAPMEYMIRKLNREEKAKEDDDA
jgi:hypothetical protein